MIRVLEKDVAAKIAAGEVIERPLSVVKELVENSIDAVPGSLTVEIKNGGKSYIRVTDNGTGIPSSDVETAFLRHATSKLKEADDLSALTTLGFRGEALPSIAAVSRTELITKTRQEEEGRRLVIEGGKIIENTAAGADNGTTVIVRDLFYNMPARKKFMRSDAAESTAVIEFVTRMALAYTNIRFRLINNGVMLFSTRGTCNRQENILTVFGKKVGKDLIPFNEACEFMEIEGYVSDPSDTRTNRKQQIFFVNGRAVSSKVLSKAITDAYSDRLFKGRYPSAYLFIVIDPASVDVNIHPNKKEIKFLNEGSVTGFITDSIRKALQTEESIPEIKEKISFSDVKTNHTDTPVNADPETLPSSNDEINEPSDRHTENSVISSISDEKQMDFKDIISNVRSELKIAEETKNEMYQTGAVKTETKTFDFSGLKIKGTIFETYIIAEKEDTFFLIDQHAAHERVNYEKFLKEHGRTEKNIQPLLTPFTIETPFSVRTGLDRFIGILNSLAYDSEEFGPGLLRINGIPAFMEISEAEMFLNDFFENCDEKTDFNNERILNKIIMRACKSSVKANDHLSGEEIHALIDQLMDCDNPFSCPHGRPVVVRMTRYEIEKMFKRV